jgi:predicted DNA-binding transcriptional regulator AlpA
MGAEIRKRLGGISRQRVWQLTTRSDFPEPYDVLGQGKVWRKNDVEEWIAEKRRKRRESRSCLNRSHPALPSLAVTSTGKAPTL